MIPKLLLASLAVVFALSIVSPTAGAAAMAKAAKPAHHYRHHVKAGGGCKGTYMYMKGGKCVDARNKA